MFQFDFVYLSSPEDTPVSSEGVGPNLRYASVSVQGWRRIQEDAVNCVLNYRNDETSSLFGVYDGHGGPEIAVYVSNHLPKKLQESIDDDSSDIKKALVKAFLNLDEDLKTTDAKKELIEILGNYVDDESGDNIQRVVMAMRAEQLKSKYDSSTNEKMVAEHPIELSTDTNENGGSFDGKSNADISAPVEEGPGTSGTAVAVDNDESSNSSSDESEMETEKDLSGPIELLKMAAPEVELFETDSDDSDYDPDKSDSSMNESESDEDDDNAAVSDMEASVYSGTTATVAVIDKNTVYVASAGDSRCVISRSYKAIDLTDDHKPENPEELKRITAAGGTVNIEGRINNGLNLSRAIGDFIYKNNDQLPPESQVVTCVPDVCAHKLTPEDRFMVLACDGIWNSFTNQEVVDYINLRLDAGNVPLVQIIKEICYRILPPDPSGDGTGLDNMSMIVVVFDEKDLEKLTDKARASEEEEDMEVA